MLTRLVWERRVISVGYGFGPVCWSVFKTHFVSYGLPCEKIMRLSTALCYPISYKKKSGKNLLQGWR